MFNFGLIKNGGCIYTDHLIQQLSPVFQSLLKRQRAVNLHSFFIFAFKLYFFLAENLQRPRIWEMHRNSQMKINLSIERRLFGLCHLKKYSSKIIRINDLSCCPFASPEFKATIINSFIIQTSQMHSQQTSNKYIKCHQQSNQYLQFNDKHFRSVNKNSNNIMPIFSH